MPSKTYCVWNKAKSNLDLKDFTNCSVDFYSAGMIWFHENFANQTNSFTHIHIGIQLALSEWMILQVTVNVIILLLLAFTGN